MKWFDGLVNVVANLGTARDKAAHSHYHTLTLSQSELVDIYRSSWLGKSIVDYPAEDATRKWRKWRANTDQITRIEALETRLQLPKRVQQAMISARLFGGAAIYINENTRSQDKPLKIGAVIDSLVVLPKSVLAPEQVVLDISSPYYGKPEFYTLQSEGKSVRIHASRLVVFVGAEMPHGAAEMLGVQGWGDSVLQSTIEAIKQVDATMANMASLVFEAKVDVFKFESFAEMLADSSNDAMLARRLNLQAAMKGINGAVVIDAKDDYDQKSASFASLPEVVAKFMEAVSGAARIPATRLYGRSAAGLSGTGDGDERVYYDRIGHMQASDMTPALAALDECLIYQALGERPPEIYYQWAPLRQLTETERADVFGKTANAARALAGSQAGELIPMDALSEALVNELTEQGMLPGLDQAIAKFGSLSGQSLPMEEDLL